MKRNSSLKSRTHATSEKTSEKEHHNEWATMGLKRVELENYAAGRCENNICVNLIGLLNQGFFISNEFHLSIIMMLTTEIRSRTGKTASTSQLNFMHHLIIWYEHLTSWFLFCSADVCSNEIHIQIGSKQCCSLGVGQHVALEGRMNGFFLCRIRGK